MGIQINIGDHRCPVYGWGSVPAQHHATVKWARRRARLVSQHMPSANRYFSKLPLGRTLTSLLDDNTIWINYSPIIGANLGQTSTEYPHEVALGTLAFEGGRWTVLGTLIHELAHVGGAPADTDQRAEQALVYCGLGSWSELKTRRDDPRTPFVPWIQG